METSYQRVAREQRERQAARLAKEEQRLKGERTRQRAQRAIAGARRRERAYEEWCTSDFPNQEGN